jgi:glycosyltransferase involved in cell wall biosynthesis
MHHDVAGGGGDRVSDPIPPARRDATGLPAIGVGLPVYNGATYVGEAIESVLDQTETDFELVICDNASTDETEEICRDYASRDPRIVYVRNQTNLGGAPNYNRCFALSSATTYFKWIAHDDTIDRRFLELCRARLEADPQASLAYPVLVEIDAEGRHLRTERANLGFLDPDAGRRARAFVEEIHRSRDVFWAVFGLARRAALLRGALHGSYVASDQVFLFELVLAGKLVHVPGTTYTRRIHPQASMTTHLSPKERSAWYDTRSSPPLDLPHWALLAHHVCAVHRSGLPTHERIGAYTAVVRRSTHEWRNLGGDVKAVARAQLPWFRTRHASIDE